MRTDTTIQLVHKSYRQEEFILITTKFWRITVLCLCNFWKFFLFSITVLCCRLDSLTFTKRKGETDGLISFYFLLADVVALVVLISNAEQIDDVILGQEGALRGLIKFLLSNYISCISHFLSQFENIQNLWICSIAEGCCLHSSFKLDAFIHPETGEAFYRQFSTWCYSSCRQ